MVLRDRWRRLFYALFGMFKLGVWLDAGLLLASLPVALLALSSRRGQRDLRDQRATA